MGEVLGGQLALVEIHATDAPACGDFPALCQSAHVSSVMPSTNIVFMQTISNLTGKAFFTDAAHNKGLPTSEPRARRGGYDKIASYLPWEVTEWTAVIVDEAHIARTTGRIYHGINAMMDAAYARLLATATPLQHTPKVNDFSIRGGTVR